MCDLLEKRIHLARAYNHFSTGMAILIRSFSQEPLNFRGGVNYRIVGWSEPSAYRKVSVIEMDLQRFSAATLKYEGLTVICGASLGDLINLGEKPVCSERATDWTYWVSKL